MQKMPNKKIIITLELTEAQAGALKNAAAERIRRLADLEIIVGHECFELDRKRLADVIEGIDDALAEEYAKLFK